MGLPSFYTLWHPDPKPKESLLQHTPPKFNMEPENEWKWYLSNRSFQGGWKFSDSMVQTSGEWIVGSWISWNHLNLLEAWKLPSGVVSWFLPFLPRLDPMSWSQKHLVSTSEKLRGKKKRVNINGFGEPVGSMGLVYVVLFVCYMYI